MKYPLILSHIYKERVWGGSRFPSQAPIGEDWVLSVRKGDQSIIVNGIHAEKELAELIGEFPLLIKFIDSKEALSIQVHPDEKSAQLLGGEAKSEMWFILGANEDSYIYYGVRDGADIDEFRALILRGEDPTPYLNKVAVKSSDVFYIPGGTPHAIGAGVYLCEVQQNSDTTYRMYDYGRPRELHLREAATAVKKDIAKECPYFSYELIESDCDISGMCILAVTEGEGRIGEYPIREGDCIYIPEGAEKCRLCGVKAIKITL